MAGITRDNLKKINDHTWEIAQSFRSPSLDKLGITMRAPVRFFAFEDMLGDILRDRSLEQAVNVATLPGIQKYSLVMPDMHEGYGAPIGGVAAFDLDDGIISPGMTGYDINCGVRLLASRVSYEEVKDAIAALGDEIYRSVPSGVGKSGMLRLSPKELDAVLVGGVDRTMEMGYATEADKEHCEAGGRLDGADPGKVSDKAKRRGADQLGTMGAGNHFVEVQRIDAIYDAEAAEAMGLYEGQVAILIHSGSRGFGHQVATDYIKTMVHAMKKHDVTLSDTQLACAPFRSLEGQDYLAAMRAAANYAWANRQLITWEVRKAWEKVFGTPQGADRESLRLVYDVAHNIVKVERYSFDQLKTTNHKSQTNSNTQPLAVHRKGATRAFPPHHPETPKAYAEVGQPVIIPGSMGTASYVLVGQEGAMDESFGSACHGAGRTMSRTQAKKKVRGAELIEELASRDIHVRAGSMAGVAEEAPMAYKDVERVVDVVGAAGLAKKVARLRPVAVVKG